MKKIAIIGAGQLGSRHLQALALLQFPAAISVVDPSSDSLNVAKERYEQMEQVCDATGVDYLQKISDLPAELDVVIVATSANVRLKVLQELTATSQVKNLILEKVLFQSIEDFQVAQKLFDDHKIAAWVNCPRRIYPFYQELQKRFDAKSTIHYEVTGPNWGIGCNAIHFIDLQAMLVGETDYQPDTSSLDPVIHDSKRAGFVEFTGTLKGSFTAGHSFSFTAKESDEEEPVQKLITETLDVEIFPRRGEAILIDKLEKREEKLDFSAPFQSQLTSLVVTEILETGACRLTTFEESAALHIPLIQAYLAFMEKITGKPATLCPIT